LTLFKYKLIEFKKLFTKTKVIVVMIKPAGCWCIAGMLDKHETQFAFANLFEIQINPALFSLCTVLDRPTIRDLGLP